MGHSDNLSSLSLAYRTPRLGSWLLRTRSATKTPALFVALMNTPSRAFGSLEANNKKTQIALLEQCSANSQCVYVLLVYSTSRQKAANVQNNQPSFPSPPSSLFPQVPFPFLPLLITVPSTPLLSAPSLPSPPFFPPFLSLPSPVPTSPPLSPLPCPPLQLTSGCDTGKCI